MSFALVIDDNKQMTDVMLEMLKALNIPARGVLSPAAAMAILEGDIPRVIFLDINMPGVDGFEVLGYLKREPRFGKVPVIVVTSDDQPDTARRAFKGGASAVMLKPVMANVLENSLKKVGIL
jgi:CheY-like chemotaxis protein